MATSAALCHPYQTLILDIERTNTTAHSACRQGQAEKNETQEKLYLASLNPSGFNFFSVHPVLISVSLSFGVGGTLVMLQALAGGALGGEVELDGAPKAL